MAATNLNSEDLAQTKFALLEFTASGGSGSPVIQSRPPRWGMSAESRWLKRSDMNELMLFLQGQGGGVGTFSYYDILRGFPRNYPNGVASLTRHAGGSFDGTIDVTARTTTTISLATLPSTYVFKAGDHISLTLSGARSLHVVQADVTAAAGVAVVTVYPLVSTGTFSTSATADVIKPRCNFRLDPSSIDMVRDGHLERVSFSAVQVLYE